MDTSNTIVVTRHKGLVEYLIEIGMITADTPIIEHATAEDVTGKHVIGVLPLWLASHAALVTEVPLNIPAEWRGQELTAAQMRQVAGIATTYKVQALDTVGQEHTV